ncbi:AfsA-related hotdog domain-containing protein [Kitasatospora sp. NPDC048545]|uniref:AfsA-related hotdog domain-containing protein n=1 Tax=Kitasatospora sp. NPDC048545 TaxID=3157208 RepID=UPI0033EA9366
MRACRRPAAHAALHLIHRTLLSSTHLTNGPSVEEEYFALSGALPAGAALPGEEDGPFHDWQHVTEILLDAGEFIGYKYFGIPGSLPARLDRYELHLTDPGAWHADRRTPRLALDLAVRPRRVIGRGTHGLDLDCGVRLDDAVCARISSALAFLAPLPRYLPEPARPAAPVRPADVGRSAPGNVLLGTPSLNTYARLSAPVLIPGGGHGLGADPGGPVPDLTLVEVARQAAVLCVRLACGLTPERTVVTSLALRRRGAAVAGAPMYCTAVPGELSVNDLGQPGAPVTLTVSQHERTVLEATATVRQEY